MTEIEKPRELQDFEKELIFNYLKKYNSQFMFEDALNRDEYVKMELLAFAKDDLRGIKHLDSQIAFVQYIYTD